MARKLKVFRTPIGFHDAYVAAPSRKAALQAWGADADLFARGMAEEVTDATLMKEPLTHPGQVVRKIRGTMDEHMAAYQRTRNASRRKRRMPICLRRSPDQQSQSLVRLGQNSIRRYN